jgi:DNA primase
MSAVDEVKQKIDIVEVVGRYVTLKKAGRNLTAPCPFHSEKTPSFFVFPERQSWHCFGACSTGGDVFSFIMKKEAVDFGEALRLLAAQAGVTLPARTGFIEKKEEKEELYKANEAAALYYNNLLLHSPAAEKARQYIVKRGFTPKSVADFQLGFAPDEWEALKKHLLEKGHKEKDMMAAGLLSESEKGKVYDRFRHKLMIPIKDARGRVTGFGARVLDDSLPKYINSPQTPLFDKSGTLYGIDRASADIRKRDAAIIMEGYMDVIMAHQCGVTNAVASMGTAITETQANILKKLSRNVILSLDSDTAGEEAMLRTVGYENILGAEMKIIKLPEGKDPDEVIMADIGVWNTLVKDAMPIVDFTFRKVASTLDLTKAGDKSMAVERLLPIIAGISDPIRQAHYLQKLATLVKVDMNTIKTALSRLKTTPARRTATAVKPAAGGTVKTPATRTREEYVLALILQHPELKDACAELSCEFFENSENREIVKAWQEAADVVSLKGKLHPAIHEHLDVMVNRDLPGGKGNFEQKINDCVAELRKKYLKSLAGRKAESAGDEFDTARLEEDVEISRQLKDLESRKNKKYGSSKS